MQCIPFVVCLQVCGITSLKQNLNTVYDIHSKTNRSLRLVRFLLYANLLFLCNTQAHLPQPLGGWVRFGPRRSEIGPQIRLDNPHGCAPESIPVAPFKMIQKFQRRCTQGIAGLDDFLPSVPGYLSVIPKPACFRAGDETPQFVIIAELVMVCQPDFPIFGCQKNGNKLSGFVKIGQAVASDNGMAAHGRIVPESACGILPRQMAKNITSAKKGEVMLSKLTNLTVEYDYGGPVENRKAWLLNIITIVVLTGVIIGTFISGGIILSGNVGSTPIIPTFWTTIITAFLFGAIWLFGNRGYTTTASRLLVATITVATFAANVDGAAAGKTLLYFVIPIMLASVLLRPADSFWVALVISIGLIVLFLVYDLSPKMLITPLGLVVIATIAWISARAQENSLLELNQANLDLADANERLTELDQLKSRFISDVSHELRTPVNNLVSYVEMLAHGISPDIMPQEKIIATLLQESGRVVSLVNSILDASRMEHGFSVARTGALIDAGEITKRVVDGAMGQAQAKELDLTLESGCNGACMRGDVSLVETVVTNLVANAINYTDAGGIVVRCMADETNIVITVDDTGKGIDPADLPYVFQRFYRGKQQRQSTVPGSGLGLAIAKEIVSAHDGTIEVESALGKGTKIVVRFPAILCKENVIVAP